jgi:hypothetical protein
VCSLLAAKAPGITAIERRQPFVQELSGAFVKKLEAEAGRGGWWANVLADPKLVVALRGTHLNVYWCGQSLFRVSPPGNECSRLAPNRRLGW